MGGGVWGLRGGGFLVVVMQCRSYAVMQGGGGNLGNGECMERGGGGGGPIRHVVVGWGGGGGGGVCQYTAFSWGAVDTRAPCGSGQLYN